MAAGCVTVKDDCTQTSLVEVPWGDDADAEHLIWAQVKQRLLRHDKEAELYQQLQAIKRDEKNQIMPAVRALQCLLMGMFRFPLRR